MKVLNNIEICPKQPYFVIATSHYYKVVIMQYGISHFYSFCTDTNSLDGIYGIPDGCVDIVFCCDLDKPYVNIYGTGLHVRPMSLEKNKYYFGVRFLPGECHGFHDISFKELIGIEVPLYEIMDKDVFQNIIKSRNFCEQIKIFMGFYLNAYSFNKDEDIHLSDYILNYIVKSTGKTRVEDIALDTGYSARYINKVFNNNFGISPKYFSKMVRFQKTINNINQYNDSNFDLADFALEMNYCDQSHMIREFKQFSNITPKEYVDFLKKKQYNKRLIILM